MFWKPSRIEFSANSTETTRRSSRGAAVAPGASGVAQIMQNRARSAFSSPQEGQIAIARESVGRLPGPPAHAPNGREGHTAPR